MGSARRTADLPENLRRYFWEYDAARLSFDQNRNTIIRRLLESGGWDAVQWLRANVGDQALRAFLIRRRGRGISPKRLRFWGLVLEIPRWRVDEWIGARASDPWHRRTFSFLEFRYALLRPPVEWPDYGSLLASLEDLACMKLSAIAGRGAKKDFVDVYALASAGVGLAEMLELYQRKFQTRDIGHVLFGLSYFDDAEPDDMPEMLWDIDWDEVKRTIEGWVSDYGRSHR